MSKLRHTLQLLHGGALSTRQIAAALGISKSTVSEIASYARVADVNWALAQTLSDDELQARLYRPPVARASRHLEPDHAHIHRELRRPGVTLQLLWEEYQQLSWTCDPRQASLSSPASVSRISAKRPEPSRSLSPSRVVRIGIRLGRFGCGGAFDAQVVRP